MKGKPPSPVNGTPPSLAQIPLPSEFKPVSVQIPIPPKEEAKPDDAPFRLTKEIRAELVARTGHDISDDDPALALIVVAEIFLRSQTERVANRIIKANEDAANQLEKLRLTTIDRTSTALVEMANAKIAEANASIRAAQAKHDQIFDLKLHHRVYFSLGAASILLLLLGFVMGLSLHH